MIHMIHLMYVYLSWVWMLIFQSVVTLEILRIHKPILALVLQKFGAEAKLDHGVDRKNGGFFGDFVMRISGNVMFWLCMYTVALHKIVFSIHICLRYMYVHIYIYILLLLHIWERLQYFGTK